MENKIRELVADVFDLDPQSINDLSSPDNIVKWDSLGHMNLVSAIEEEFDFELDDDDIDNLRNFALIVKIVSERLGV